MYEKGEGGEVIINTYIKEYIGRYYAYICIKIGNINECIYVVFLY